MADMSLGLSTAPLLYAAQERRELVPMIKRRFKNDGDKEEAVHIARQTNGVERATELAWFHADCAAEAIARLPDSESRQGLGVLLRRVLSRKS